MCVCVGALVLWYTCGGLRQRSCSSTLWVSGCRGTHSDPRAWWQGPLSTKTPLQPFPPSLSVDHAAAYIMRFVFSKFASSDSTIWQMCLGIRIFLGKFLFFWWGCSQWCQLIDVSTKIAHSGFLLSKKHKCTHRYIHMYETDLFPVLGIRHRTLYINKLVKQSTTKPQLSPWALVKYILN